MRCKVCSVSCREVGKYIFKELTVFVEEVGRGSISIDERGGVVQVPSEGQVITLQPSYKVGKYGKLEMVIDKDSVWTAVPESVKRAA
jgi:hypothetical protein